MPRTSFHSSEFIRCLADLEIADVADPGNAFAEKLGGWIHFADAITLSAVHKDSIASRPQAQTGMQHDRQAAACAAELDRIRALLVNAVTASCSPRPGRTHIKLPTPVQELPLDLATAYPPYRRFYEAHQRDMELGVQPLRVNVREALAKASPELRKLAELDATLEKILRERESKLLAKVPVLLKKHFESLFKEHQQKLAVTEQADNPAGWTRTGGWLAHFCNDMQMLLLAEIELRLQPTMGLIEAFRQDTQ
ncbi:MAG TPA: DUF3348 domain-containing protein [Noviherbaspirillum sp.]|uniref:DUF3348 domain-containing protein n=1 Tax=Noviherbaspirillum sp. TaxID=1926288 RepID=UPI002B48D6A9|nr:DUF3348 domain-containing protein [Noviherbaspirillum sp.]HJV84654.1 DUF3348 domain-containing protein [Noviherbaspirillum sp.]